MTQTQVRQSGLDIEALQEKYAEKSPMQILEFALGQFEDIAISFSGAEDVVLIDMATKIRDDIKWFYRSGSPATFVEGPESKEEARRLEASWARRWRSPP